jgi:DNA-binding response OmpR family regulator
MQAQSENPHKSTVLVVAEDLRILALAQAVLARKGNRVLLTNDAQDAVRFLTRSRVPIDSVAIQAGMSRHEEVRNWSLRRGARPWVFHCDSDERGIRLKGLDSGADWESAALEA